MKHVFTKEIVNVSDQQFQDKREVISYLADLADKAGKITDKKSYVEADFETRRSSIYSHWLQRCHTAWQKVRRLRIPSWLV